MAAKKNHFHLHNGRNGKLTDFGGTVIDKVFI